jgi:hypothetical protein
LGLRPWLFGSGPIAQEADSNKETIGKEPKQLVTVAQDTVVRLIRLTALLMTLLFSCLGAQVGAAEETAERPARAAQCFLDVNGVHYAGGDCLFRPLDKLGSFRIDAGKGLSAQVKVKAASEGIASWSGPQGGDAAAIPLCDAYNSQRGCWDADDPNDPSKETHVCAWDKGQQLYLAPTPVEASGRMLAGASAKGCTRGSSPVRVSIPSTPA